MATSTVLKPKLSVLQGSKLYRELREELIGKNILSPSYNYYLTLSIFTSGAFILSLLFVILSKEWWQTLIFTSIFAFFTVQLAGIIHDAGHRAIFRSSKFNDILGHILGIVLATGYEQWRVKHNAHHAHTNDEDDDPDMKLPVLSFNIEKARQKKGIEKFLVRYQHFIYYPMGTLVIFSTRLNNIGFLKKNFKVKLWWQVLFYGLGLFIWFVMPFLAFDVIKTLLFLVTFQVVAGIYMFQVFAPNHKGMPYVTKGTKVSFLEQQIVTSRNLNANWLIDYIYLGLNYQIEHHLFPNCPRNKLGRVKKYVEKFCKKYNIDYTEVNFFKTNQIILSELYSVAQAVKY